MMSADIQTDRKIDRLTDRHTGRQTVGQILSKIILRYPQAFYSRRGPPFRKRFKLKWFKANLLMLILHYVPEYSLQ